MTGWSTDQHMTAIARIGIGPSRPRIRGELECCLAGQAFARQAASPGRGRMDQRDAI